MEMKKKVKYQNRLIELFYYKLAVIEDKKKDDKDIKQMHRLLKLINRRKFDQKKFKAICYIGIPVIIPGFRAFCWRIMLGGLKNKPRKWDE